jgi:hypothetical protein
MHYDRPSRMIVADSQRYHQHTVRLGAVRREAFDGHKLTSMAKLSEQPPYRQANSAPNGCT